MKCSSENNGCHLGNAAFRISLGGSTVLNWYHSVYESRSMMFQAGAIPDGKFLITLMMLLGVVAIIEAIVNDLLPRRFNWISMWRKRHLLLLALAFCSCAQLYVAIIENHRVGLWLYLVWNIFSFVLCAITDAAQRSKEDPKCAAICS